MVVKHPHMNAYWEDKNPKITKIDIPMYVLMSYSTGLHTEGSFRGWKYASSKDKWYEYLPLDCYFGVAKILGFAFMPLKNGMISISQRTMTISKGFWTAIFWGKTMGGRTLQRFEFLSYALEIVLLLFSAPKMTTRLPEQSIIPYISTPARKVFLIKSLRCTQQHLMLPLNGKTTVYHLSTLSTSIRRLSGLPRSNYSCQQRITMIWMSTSSYANLMWMEILFSA